MRILLTGAGGFLGSHLLRMLVDRHEVTAIGRQPPAAAGGAVRWIRADLSVSIELAELPSRVDAVVHLAQSRRYRDFPDGALDVFRVNLAATAELLDYARRAGAHTFLLASTGSVYGPQAGPLAEHDAALAEDFYPMSKLAAELLLRPYARYMSVCALRLFTLYGPGQAGMLVANLIERVRRGEPLTVAGNDDGPSFNPTYVEDAAAVLSHALDAKWTGTINVAAPQTVTLRQLGSVIGEIVGRAPLFRRTEGAASISPVPDLSRLAKIYRMERFRPIRDGLRLTISP